MNKLLAFIPCLLVAGVAVAQAQKVHSTLTITSGWTKNQDGTLRSLKGVQMPVTITPIEIDKLKPRRVEPVSYVFKNQDDTLDRLSRFGVKTDGLFGDGDFLAETVVYNSNFGVYGVIDPGEFSNPSSLDDITLSSIGPGKLWTKLGFGFQTDLPTGTPFLVRFRCYDTNIENPAGTSDFINEFADFGGILGLNPTFPPGAYYVQINPSQAGVLAPNTTMFMGVQFRQPQLNGEGAFLPQIRCIYNNTSSPPSVGSSENSFIFDNDQLDGIYENSEIDVFDGTRGDLALDISVDSNTNSLTLFPSNATTTIGSTAAGSFVSLLFGGDSDVYEVNPTFAIPRDSPIAGFETEAFSPTASPLALSFDATTFATTPSMDCIVEFWNFQTNAWVQIDRRAISTSPTSYSVTYGGLVPLARFVRQTTPRILRARVSFINTTSGIPRAFRLQTDKFNWNIVF